VERASAKNIPAEAGAEPKKIVIGHFRLVLVQRGQSSIYVGHHIGATE
jgi:hypothetical protein